MLKKCVWRAGFMKKILLVCVLLLVAVGCSSGDTRSLDTFIKAYQDAGVEVDPEEKPIFTMVGAINGVIFYQDGSKVAIYEYESEKELEKAKASNNLIKTWKSNGKFLLETDNEKAAEIFDSVK